jgi:hypothetical protein
MRQSDVVPGVRSAVHNRDKVINGCAVAPSCVAGSLLHLAATQMTAPPVSIADGLPRNVLVARFDPLAAPYFCFMPSGITAWRASLAAILPTVGATAIGANCVRD